MNNTDEALEDALIYLWKGDDSYKKIYYTAKEMLACSSMTPLNNFQNHVARCIFLSLQLYNINRWSYNYLVSIVRDDS